MLYDVFLSFCVHGERLNGFFISWSFLIKIQFKLLTDVCLNRYLQQIHRNSISIVSRENVDGWIILYRVLITKHAITLHSIHFLYYFFFIVLYLKI